MNKKITYIVGAFLIQGITFLSTIFLAKMITPSDYAIVSSYNFIITIFAVFAGLNMESTIPNAFFDYPSSIFNKYCKRLCIFSFFITLIIMCVVLLIQKSIISVFNLPINVVLIGIIQSFFNFLFLIYTSILIVRNRPKMYVFFGSFNSIFNLIIMLLMIYYLKTNKYLGKVYSSLICSLIFGILAFIALMRMKTNKENRRLREDFQYAFNLSGPLIFHSIGAIVMGRSDQIMIMNLLSTAEAGIYGFANNFGNITSVFVAAFNKPYVPWYYDCMKTGKIEEIKKGILHHTKSFTYLFFCILLAIPEVIMVLSDKEYITSIYIAPFSCLAFYISFLYTIVVNHEFYSKKTKYISIGTIICCLINISTNFFIIPVLGSIGASITTVLSNFILLCIHYYIARYKIGEFAMNFKFFLRYTLTGILFLFFTLLIKPYFILRLFILLFCLIMFLKEMRYK